MKQKYVISIFLALMAASVVASDIESPGEQNSEPIDDHHKVSQEVLPSESADNLLSLDKLLKGPEELVQLVSEDEKLQKTAFETLLSSKTTYDKYGEQILPYVAYVISDLEKRNAKQALRFLFVASQHLNLKARRGPLAAVDEKALEVYMREIPENVPELEAYPPLKPILLHTFKNSPESGNRETAAWILVQAYDASREIEEALAMQIRDKRSGKVNMDIVATIGHMSMSEKYSDGFLSPLTMGIMIESLDDDNISNLGYITGFIGRYKPKAALPKLMQNISNEGGVKFLFSSNALGVYGSDASEYIPQLEAILSEEKDDAHRKQLKKVINQLSTKDVAK